MKRHTLNRKYHTHSQEPKADGYYSARVTLLTILVFVAGMVIMLDHWW